MPECSAVTPCAPPPNAPQSAAALAAPHKARSTPSVAARSLSLSLPSPTASPPALNATARPTPPAALSRTRCSPMCTITSDSSTRTPPSPPPHHTNALSSPSSSSAAALSRCKELVPCPPTLDPTLDDGARGAGHLCPWRHQVHHGRRRDHAVATAKRCADIPFPHMRAHTLCYSLTRSSTDSLTHTWPSISQRRS